MDEESMVYPPTAEESLQHQPRSQGGLAAEVKHLGRDQLEAEVIYQRSIARLEELSRKIRELFDRCSKQQSVLARKVRDALSPPSQVAPVKEAAKKLRLDAIDDLGRDIIAMEIAMTDAAQEIENTLALLEAGTTHYAADVARWMVKYVESRVCLQQKQVDDHLKPKVLKRLPKPAAKHATFVADVADDDAWDQYHPHGENFMLRQGGAKAAPVRKRVTKKQ